MKTASLFRFALLLLLVLPAAPAAAQCLLPPGGPGENGQTWSQNFFTLVNDLYADDFHPTHSFMAGGQLLQAPPWYSSSTDCDAAHLKDGSGAINPPIASPSFSDYLVVSDELSELAVVTALADNDTRMMAIHHTIQAMASATHPGLPCWIAEVSGGSLTCRSQDTATDATARFGLAYYHAANNPTFPAASRTIYRAAGNALAARHLATEYAQGQCYTSSVTQQQVCNWVGGGGDTAAAGVGNLKMWIGYFQDVARFLLAAYVSTGDRTYSDRAAEVVDQWLIASTFDSTHLTFGRTNFGWDTTAQPIAPRPGDAYYWQQGRAWDDADAPRALWMGDVLRAVDLATGHAPLARAYAKLSSWVQKLLANGTQTATTSCVQYNQDGTVQYNQNGTGVNCGTDYFYNGLGAGLSTYDGTSLLADKLGTALSQFGWTATHPTWNSAACFGIYRGIRPVKALASAIGLDAATWGGTPCAGASSTLTVTAAGTGSGTVGSSPAGISCPSSCVATFAPGTMVSLSATASAGSSFSGWSGACGGTGGCTVTLDANRAVTATFTANGTPPAAPTWLRVTTVSASELKLTWQDNSNNETGFKVERKEGCCGPWTPLPDAPANSTGTATYESTGLKCGTSYAYRVWAFNAAGASAKTNEAAASTAACP
ncbi:MAG TPA: fibronectin type III domain-containing protein [Thermoanaerobaculia bacterium]|nr:fibronectin type III domain-containing protein [Thermoanaerobaculia bacterium]